MLLKIKIVDNTGVYNIVSYEMVKDDYVVEADEVVVAISSVDAYPLFWMNYEQFRWDSGGGNIVPVNAPVYINRYIASAFWNNNYNLTLERNGNFRYSKWI